MTRKKLVPPPYRAVFKSKVRLVVILTLAGIAVITILKLDQVIPDSQTDEGSSSRSDLK